MSETETSVVLSKPLQLLRHRLLQRQIEKEIDFNDFNAPNAPFDSL